MWAQARLNSFSEVIEFIANSYRKDSKRKGNRNDLSWDREFRNFINRLKEYAKEINEYNLKLFIGKPDDKQHLRHSIKNIIFYAILRLNDYNYEKSLREFSELSGLKEEAVLEEAMLSSYQLKRGGNSGKGWR